MFYYKLSQACVNVKEKPFMDTNRGHRVSYCVKGVQPKLSKT